MLDKQHQFILLEILWHYVTEKRSLHRKDIINLKIGESKIPVFCNNQDFFKKMKELIDMGYIKNEANGSFCFKMNGWALANIIALQSNTPKKYSQLAVEITWLP